MSGAHDLDACASNHCEDCELCAGAPGVDLSLISADLGHGAFLTVLCDTCWHRRQYIAELRKRLAERAAYP